LGGGHLIEAIPKCQECLNITLPERVLSIIDQVEPELESVFRAAGESGFGISQSASGRIKIPTVELIRQLLWASHFF
jgi:hypothetical protein